MGLRDEIQADIAEAFNEDLADAVTTFTCTKLIYSEEFDFATQTYPIIGEKTYSGRGVFGSYERDLVKPANYQVEDVKAIVLQNEVNAVPQIDDVWLTSGGTFKVLSVGKDPASVSWRVQLRLVASN